MDGKKDTLGAAKKDIITAILGDLETPDQAVRGMTGVWVH
jgi:hypothetical protein